MSVGRTGSEKYSRCHKRRGRGRSVEEDAQRGVVEVGYDGSSRACYTLALFPGAGSARRRRSCQGGELQIRGGLWGKMAGYARAVGAKNGKSSPRLAGTVESQPGKLGAQDQLGKVSTELPTP